jgi:hypothetical protein
MMWYRNGTCTHADPNNCWQRPATQELLVGRKNVIKSNLLFEHFLLAYVIQFVSVPLTQCSKIVCLNQCLHLVRKVHKFHH